MELALDNEFALYTSLAYSRNTKRAYKTHRDSYLSFCKFMGYTAVPAASLTLCRYATFLARSLKFNSVKQYLNIVRLLHLEWGLPNPLKDNFCVNNALKGIRRHLGDSVTQKRPITPDVLKLILSKLDVSHSFDASVWAACLIMFYGLLRKSNVLVTSESTFDSDKHLRRRDIIIFHWGIALLIRWSKTNQFNSKTIKTPLPRLRSNPLCPVQAIVNALQLSIGANPDGPALVYKLNRKIKALSYDRFIARVRQTLSACNLEGTQFASHSFRRGGATHCYAIGLSAESIKLIGDWSSSCYTRYIEKDFESRYKIVSQMQKYV